VQEADGDALGVRGATGAGSAPGLIPGRVVAYSWLMAAAAIGVLNQLHADLHEHHDLPPFVHWLRDAALAVPMAAIAVVVVALIVRSRLSSSGGETGRSIAGPLTWTVLAAFVFAALSIPGIQLHGLLFGAEEESVGWVQDALKDGGITLATSLAVLVPVALVLGPPWRAARPATKPIPSPGPSLAAKAGHSASLVTSGSTHAGGDR
jgi:hypothetical protein